MKQYTSQLKSLINLAKELAANISQSVNYNTPFDNRIQQLLRTTKQIIPLIKDNYPEIASILEKAISRIVNRQAVPGGPYGAMMYKDLINAFFYGDIRTAIDILDVLYSSINVQKHKIFISHSSKDKEIITEFTDHILQLGIGLEAKNIFCTSIEDMNIKNGEDIRNHIKDNILSADYSFIMISENYKKSEICLNEMGAVWTNDNNVRYYLLPNTEVEKIGWLCDTKQVECISNPTALDKLYKEVITYYNLTDRFETWSRQRGTFISSIVKNIDKSNKIQSNQISNIQNQIMELLKNNSCMSINDLAQSIGVSRTSIQNNLNILQANGKIKMSGTMRNIQWEIIEA